MEDKLYIIFAAIPIVGWIALGILAGIVYTVKLAIFIAMLVNGYYGTGFKVGVDVKTGFLGIPTGVKWVCE